MTAFDTTVIMSPKIDHRRFSSIGLEKCDRSREDEKLAQQPSTKDDTRRERYSWKSKKEIEDEINELQCILKCMGRRNYTTVTSNSIAREMLEMQIEQVSQKRQTGKILYLLCISHHPEL